MAQAPLLDPIQPAGMDLTFHYVCPYCHTVTRVGAPTQAMVINCSKCRKQFPIAPVDELILNFFHIITCDGRAMVSTDYL